MKSVGGEEGLDLTQDIKPPKSLYIEVSASGFCLWTNFLPNHCFLENFTPIPRHVIEQSLQEYQSFHRLLHFTLYILPVSILLLLLLRAQGLLKDGISSLKGICVVEWVVWIPMRSFAAFCRNLIKSRSTRNLVPMLRTVNWFSLLF